MAYSGYTGEDVVSKAMLDQLDGLTQEYRKVELQLAAAEGDRESALTNWMETTDDTQAVKIRTLIETNQKKLRELAEAKVKETTLSDEDKAKLQAELDTYKGKVSSGFSLVKNLIENLSTDPEGVKAALETIDNPVKSNRGRKPGSAGSSLPRVSAIVTITGGNFEKPQTYDTLSAAATALSAEVKDLQLAFAKAAGVEHSAISSVKKPVNFEFQVHENGAVYKLHTEPKDRKKPGPAPKTETKSEAPAETKSEEKAA